VTDRVRFDRRLFRPRRPEDFDALHAGIEAATIETTGVRDSAQAWLATITRVEAAGRMA
jgi:hypothetical protein